MNKRHYKVIFSRVLNQLVVVSELAKSQGKAQSENVSAEQEKTGLFSTALSLNPIHFSLMLALGFVFLAPSVHAEDMAIRADKSAPNNQQPTVLQTANGLPQVNIQTPSAGGVSRNQYSQFDVAEKGAILNNARQATQTQMAGWVQGNPNLARGEAKVILNEVNSANPSRLKGYVEVAGKKADVVIANPSGIQCDGCGVINAGRTTLTTGKADVENGELKVYRVRGGKVTVGQKGMDTSKADYTDIIAEKAEIKGGVWAKQVKVTTGKNNVDRTNDSVVYVGDKNTDNTDRTSETQGENQSYSVDVSQLGGMYAEKIHLVDNGQGLGVRNAGHIGTSAGSVKIDSQGKIVNEGFIGGSENAQLNAKKNIENRGTVYAKAQTQLNAHNINNKKGVIAGKQVQLNTNNVDNRKQSDKGSLIVASEKVSIKAKNLDNSGTKSNSQNVQGIKARLLNVVADTVSNQQGTINVSDEGRIKTAQLSNQQGDILSGGKIVVEGDKASTVVDNTGGRLHSDSQLDLTAKTLVNEGNISSRGNANIALKDGLNLKNAFKVDGTLNFSTEGKLTNNVALRIGQAAIIHAAEVENIKNAEISADATQITTERLTNRGLIDGTTTYLDASTLNNLGTGRIYGDHLSIASSELTNDKEGEHSATIAARQRLDFGVGTLVNRDHAFIFSQDKLYIGGGLDDKGYAVGKATFIDNASATIEALGDGAINTHRLWNHDIHLKMGEVISYEGFSLFSLPNSSESYRGGVDGYMNWNNKNRHDNNAYFTFYDQLKGRIGSPNWHAEYFTRKTITPTIEHQDPAKITFGGNLTLQGDGFENYASKFLIGKRLTLGDQIVESNKTNGDIGHAGGVQLRNKDAVANILKFDNGEAQEIGAEKHHCGKRHRCWGHYNHGTTQIYERPLSPVPHYFKVVDNTIGESIASTGSVDAYHKSGNVASIDINANLPTESLYQINPNANSHYLVETDPKFTDRNKWLSSDYMFKQLRNDPQNMLKRLGDGFYEQHLVSEQINQLTGRRFLGNYSSDYDQYKALMDNGAYYAKKMNLVPGVALTSSQMKELTSDMVWMVKREVTLKDGSKKEVLVPQVYVVGRNTDIDSRGAVISANDVIMNIKGDVQNSGVISGRNLTGLAANNIENLGGRLQGRELYLVAKNMLNNLGGELNATDRLVAQGKHINIESTTTETENTPDFYQKSLTQQASVKVGNDNKKGSASFIATENITVKGVNVDVNGNAVFSAGKALNFGTVETENKAHYVPNADNYYKLDQKQEVGSQLNVTGNLDAIGKSAVEMRAVSITSNGTINILSKGNINIQEARDKEQLSSASKSKSKGFLTKETEERRHHHDYDLAKGSRLQGKNVEILSQTSNISVKGSEIQAEKNIHLQGNQVKVTASLDKMESQDSSSFKKSGLSVSGKGGVMQIGYQRDKLNNNGSSYNENVNGSELVAKDGNLSIYSQQDVDVDASRLASGKDMSISGKNVHLNAVNELHDSEYHQKRKSTGFGMGFVYDPAARAKENYRQKEAQGATKSVVGKAIGVSDAVADSIESMVRGIQPYANHNRSEANKYNQKTEAQTTSLEAGGKLNIHAREGDIRTQGSNISAEGDAQFIAAKNVDFGVAVHEQSQHASSRQRGVGVDGLAKYVAGVHTQRENGDTSLRQEVGSQISIGGKSTTIAENGDITLKGTAFVADGKNILQANNGNVKLLTAETTDSSVQMRKGHSVGEAAISDTERFFGYNRTRMSQNGEQVTHKGSQLVSLNNTVDVYAGKDYQQTASEVLAKDKVDINAQNITINNAINHQDNSYSESDLKIGQFSRVKSPIIDLINAVEGAVRNDKASDRLKAANVMSVAAQGYNLYNAFSKMATKDPKSNTYLLRVESGSGVAHSRQSQESLGDISQGSRINAKEINLIARGDGSLNEKGERQLGNINLTHTDLTSRDEEGKRIKDSKITLTGNELNIKAGESHTQFKGRNQSVGVEVGIAATVGAQTGVGVYARVGGSSGKEDGESKTYQASHLDAQTVTLNSQSDTNLIGSQVAGNKVNANVGGKLNIESLQDEERFKTKSSGGGLEVEFGFGNNWSLSGYGNASKGTTHRKQVNEQAGIFAEEGGYHINADSVHLKGGAIASINAQNSILQTNTLTFEDIQNESSSSAASASISGSIKESKEKWVDNETGSAVKPNTENSTKLDSQRSGGISPGLPMFERDSDSSVTRATLTEGTIILNKDTHPTQTTAKELGINTDLAQANNQVAQTKDVKAQIQEQQQISTAIGNVKSAVDTYTSNKQEEAEQEVRRLKSRLEKAEQQGNQETVNQLKKDLMQAEAQAENWGTGGSTKRAVDAITNAGLIALSGGSSQSIATAAVSPYVNQLIKKATEDYPALNIPTHILWGAVEAELMGGKASTGAISTAAGELGAKYLTEHLYNKEAKDLTETERNQVKEMAKAIAGVAGGLAAAGQGASAVKILSESSIGTTVANNAVENNAVAQGDIHGAYQRLLNGEDIEVVLRDLEHLSQKERDKLLADCDAACRQVVPSLLMAANDFSEEQAIAIGSILSKIPADQRSRVDMLVQSENSKTLEAIENSKSDVEKHIALAVKVMRFFQAENAVSGGKSNKPKAISVHSENKDYSKDVANLGVNRNKGLNERISNRQKDHYINEQATKNVHKVTAPIDFDGHILNAEIKGKKVVGGHSIASGNIRVDKVVKAPNANGVYEAKISVRDPNNPGKFLSKTNNNGKSTMFPDSWTSDRLKVEVDYAYKNRVPHSDPLKASKGMWQGVTKSGVKVEGYVSPKTTAYPLM